MVNIVLKGCTLASFVYLLSACALELTPGQRMANFSNQCQSYGFKPQTDPYANCMMKLDVDDQRNTQKASQCSSAAASAGANYYAAYSLCMAVSN